MRPLIQITLRKKLSRHFRGYKILFRLVLHQNSLQKKNNITCDNSNKTVFTCFDLVEFQITVKNEYPTLSSNVMPILFPFAIS